MVSLRGGWPPAEAVSSLSVEGVASAGEHRLATTRTLFTDEPKSNVGFAYGVVKLNVTDHALYLIVAILTRGHALQSPLLATERARQL